MLGAVLILLAMTGCCDCGLPGVCSIGAGARVRLDEGAPEASGGWTFAFEGEEASAWEARFQVENWASESAVLRLWIGEERVSQVVVPGTIGDQPAELRSGWPGPQGEVNAADALDVPWALEMEGAGALVVDLQLGVEGPCQGEAGAW